MYYDMKSKQKGNFCNFVQLSPLFIYMYANTVVDLHESACVFNLYADLSRRTA